MDTLHDDRRPDLNRSMRLSIGLSYDLLAKEDEKAYALFPRLSVLGASFDHRAVSTICEVEHPLLLLDALVTRSLVRFDRERYSLHAVVRSYAHEQLGDRHLVYELQAALYFMQYAMDFANNFDALEVEKGNLFATMEWAEQTAGQEHVALGLLDLLQTFLDRRGYWEERLLRAKKALQIAEILGDKSDVFRLTMVIGDTYFGRDELEAAERHFQRALQVADSMADDNAIGSAKFLLATISYQRERWAQARERALQATELFETRHMGEFLPLIYSQLAVIEQRDGHFDLAYRYAEKELDVARTGGDHDILSHALRDLCEIAIEAYDYERAEQYIAEFEALSQTNESPEMLAELPMLKGTLALRREQWAEATRYFRAALPLRERLGGPTSLALIYSGLAAAAKNLSDLNAAEGYYKKYVEIMRSVGNRRNAADGLRRLSRVQEELGEPAEAEKSRTAASALETGDGGRQDGDR